MITSEMLKKYYMITLEEYKKEFPENENVESEFYQTFLKQTDYIPLKIIEGASTKEEYKEEFEAREFARSEIRRLEMM